MAEPTMWDFAKYVFGPSGVALDKAQNLQRSVAPLMTNGYIKGTEYWEPDSTLDSLLGGTGSFRNSVMDSAPRTLFDHMFFPDKPTPGREDLPNKGSALAKRAFERMNLPEVGGTASSIGGIGEGNRRAFHALTPKAIAAQEQGPVGAFMEQLFPNAHDVAVGMTGGSWPAPSDIAAGLADVAPGPAEAKAAFATLGPAKNLAIPFLKGVAGSPAAAGGAAQAGAAVGSAAQAVASSPIVQAALTGAKAAAPLTPIPFAARALANEAEDMARRNIEKAGSPLDAMDGITDFDPLNPNWVHPRMRGNVTPFAPLEQKRLGEGGGQRGTVDAQETTPFEGRQRHAFPGVYGRPDEIVDDANVAPESPNLSRLFGVTRKDLSDTALNRQGNLPDWVPEGTKPRARGSANARKITTPENEDRIKSILEEARTRRPDLYEGMTGWYTMDPLHDRQVSLLGKELGDQRFVDQQTIMGLASPGADVITEINRGSRADYMNQQGEFEDFLKMGGNPHQWFMEQGWNAPRTFNRFNDPLLEGMRGHAYHSTSQAPPMESYLERGSLGQAAKVPAYIMAGRVPGVGFQSHYPVGDAHWARGVGLADVRTNKAYAQSASLPEMHTLAPWYTQLARDVGLEGVPAQALQWGALGRQTGVQTPVGAPKLELLSDQIALTAQRLGLQPEDVRDRFLGVTGMPLGFANSPR